MARTLVIGGTLFIGRTLVQQLLERGDDVVIMHRGTSTPFGERVDTIRCDRNDIGGVRKALTDQRFDTVYDNVYDWERGTTAEQVTAAATAVGDGLERYVFMSSVAVYPPGGEHDEDAALVPSDHPNTYGAQKADSERALFALHEREGIPVATLRPTFVYGPYNPFDREAFFWDRILAGRPVIVPDDGSRTMQWVYSLDVARAAILAATTVAAAGRTYNLAGYPPITQNDFVRLLATIAGKPVELVHVPRERIERAGGQLAAPPLYFGAYLDLDPITARSDRVREELGLRLTPLEDGLRETFRWYRDQAGSPRRPDFSFDDRLLAAAR